MSWQIEKTAETANSVLEIRAEKVGSDILICLSGGSHPHIGCVVQAVPRPSLKGDGTVSATSSVLNLTGHKEEVLCRMLAEKVCCACNAVVVCTGGFHLDNITPAQISEVMGTAEMLGDEILAEIAKM